MFQQGEFEQANHFSGITALVDAALTSHDDPAAEIAPLEAPRAPAQHPVQQIAQIDASSGAQIVPVITAPTAEWPVYADLDADRLAEARKFCPPYKPNNIKFTGYKPPKSKPRMCELWQVVMECDATQRPKMWTLVKRRRSISRCRSDEGPVVRSCRTRLARRRKRQQRRRCQSNRDLVEL